MENYPGYELHQIAPYIGKIRPLFARQLILKYTNINSWVWDPFCGSGTIPLECRLLSRNIIAADINPYACAITRSKLHAPTSSEITISNLSNIFDMVKNYGVSEDNIPDWVNKFFDNQTLIETLLLLSHLKKTRQYFIIGCLL
ncbi:DNA methyltransferase, partial [Chloroflexota bacterium]